MADRIRGATPTQARDRGLAGRIFRRLGSPVAALVAARRGWRALHNLADLDERDLRDVGLFASDLDHAIASVPRWRDPIPELAMRADAQRGRPARQAGVSAYTPGHTPSAVAFMARRRAATHAGFFLPHLRPGMRLLDCGCGPGTMTVDLARIVAPGEVVGFDLAAGQSEVAAREAARDALAVAFQTGDVLDPPFPPSSFDAVFAHALVEHLDLPGLVVARLARLLRPGGVIGVRSPDWDGFLVEPCPPRVRAALDRYRALMIERGGDPLAGRRLPGLLREAGLERVRPSASYELYEHPAEIAEYLAIQLDPHDPAGADALRKWGNDRTALFAQAWVEAVGWADAA